MSAKPKPTYTLGVRELGPYGVVETMTNKQGLKLQTYFWSKPASTPKGAIILIHGDASYLLFNYNKIPDLSKTGAINQYEGGFIEGFVEAGFAVCGLDHQSCGWSDGVDGLRSYFLRFSDLVSDVLQLADSLDSRPGFQHAPKFLMGSSMGGCVAVSAAHQAPGKFAGCCLLAPMLSLERVKTKGLNKYLLPFGQIGSLLLPWLPIASTSKNDKYPDLQAIFREDPITYTDKTRARVAFEYISQCDFLMQEMDKMTFPFLTFHSDNDDMVDPAASSQLYARSQAKHKEYVKVNDNWHILSHEPGREAILAKTIAWLSERAAEQSRG